MAVGAGAGEPVGEVICWILVACPAIRFSRVPGGGMADGEHGGTWPDETSGERHVQVGRMEHRQQPTSLGSGGNMDVGGDGWTICSYM